MVQTEIPKTNLKRMVKAMENTYWLLAFFILDLSVSNATFN